LELTEALRAVAETYGYGGVFLVSLMGSLVHFLPVPYLFVVVLLSKSLDPVLLGWSQGSEARSGS
jgi:hypothetical protein